MARIGSILTASLLVLTVLGCTTQQERIYGLLDEVAWTEYESDAWNRIVDQLVAMDRTAARELVSVLPEAWHKGEHFREYREERDAIRAAAARALGRLKYRPAAAKVIAYTTNAYPKEVRMECAWAFGEIRDVPTFDLSTTQAKLETLLVASDPELRLAGAEAVCKFDDDRGGRLLIEALGRDDAGIRRRAESSLLACDHHAVPSLVRARDAESEIQRILFQLRDRLIGTLSSGDRVLRRAAATALGDIGDREAVAALLSSLREDEDSSVRLRAATSLSRMGDQTGIEYLFAALGSTNSGDRLNAIRAVVDAGPAVERELRRLLGEGTELERAAAACALGDGGHQGSVDVLMAALEDSATCVRMNAAISLGKLRASEAASALRSLFSDESGAVAYYARWALARIEPSRTSAFVAAYSSGG